MPVCATVKQAPILRTAISGFRKSWGTQRGIAKVIESALPDLPVLTKGMEPLFKADHLAAELRTTLDKGLREVIGNKSNNAMEEVLAHALNPAKAAEFYGSAEAGTGEKLAQYLAKSLEQHLGYTNADAMNFLRRDIPKLRKVDGDFSRLDINNIIPKTFKPLLPELEHGSLDVTHDNAYVFSRQLIDAIGRAKHVRPVAQEIRREMASWRSLGKTKGIPGEDLNTAEEFLTGVINSRLSNQDEIVKATMSTFRGLMDNLAATGVPGAETLKKTMTDDLIFRIMNNSTAYFSSFAMAFNPALVMRQVMQPTLGMFKVGPEMLGKGYRQAYAKGAEGEAFRKRAAERLNISLEAGAPVMLTESGDAVIANRVGRMVMDAQQKGLMPYRWGDKMNRFVSFSMGEQSMLKHGQRYIDKKITWEEMLFETGLKGSAGVEQTRIKQLLDREIPDIAEAAAEYGKTLALDTQFLYSAMNAPQMFRGTLGRMAGQFGMFPISFGEYMIENTVGARDAKWAHRFASRWAALQMGLIGVSAATGVDTSTWLHANPLTFEGGPWFQAFRDISTLGVSTNEFERREATAKLRKIFGNSTTGAMGGVFNPFGGQTTNLFQGLAEEDPSKALLLGLGFNLTDSGLATRR
jgi:hypothetical protein